jgi:hypothetical protein
VKLWSGKLAVKLCSEALESFGGAGYIEDTGLPQLLRDAQVYAIWEGTTNVLSLDSLRALSGGGLAPLRSALAEWLGTAASSPEGIAIGQALDAAEAQLQHDAGERAHLEANARALAISLARIAAAALLARQASWAQIHGDARPAAALRGFLEHGLLRLRDAQAFATDRHLLLE